MRSVVREYSILYFLLQPKNTYEDIEPNIESELQHYVQSINQKVSISSAAKSKYLAFSLSPFAQWKTNFRVLNSSIIRMALLSSDGRITEANVDNEMIISKKHTIEFKDL